MAEVKQKSIINTKSKLLNESDHKNLFDLFNQGCLTLATTVVQLVHAPGPQFNRWVKQSCGVLTFIKDNPKRSYFIRLYNLKGRMMLFEQELYNNFTYNQLTPEFFYFDGSDCPIGLSFSDREEALQFYNTVNEKMLAKRKRRSNIEGRRSVRPVSIQPSINENNSNVNNNGMIAVASQNNVRNFIVEKKSKSKKNKKKTKISKTEIGMPTNFVQLQHFGVDGITGPIDPKKADEQTDLIEHYWSIIQSVGISREQIANDELTRQFMLNFIAENKDKFQEELLANENKNKPGPSATIAPPAYSFHPVNNIAVKDEAPPIYSKQAKRVAPRASGPPAPPGRTHVPRQQPPIAIPAPPPAPPSSAPTPAPTPALPLPPHSVAYKPVSVKPKPNAPRPGRGMSAPPPPPPPQRPSGKVPPPPVSHVTPSTGTQAPPPPPPPPAPTSTPAPPPPPPSTEKSRPDPPVADDRSNLLSAIRGLNKGGLKKVSEQQRPASTSNGRSSLMNDIRGGIVLKQASPTETRRESHLEEEGGLAGALARALAIRGNAMADTDSDSDEEDEDDDEWSD